MRTREQKQSEVDALREKITSANSVVLADYRGLTVSDANDLRGRLRKAGDGGIEYRIAKNTLLKLAVAETDAAKLGPMLVGPTALALAYDEPASLARVLVDYAKENDKFEIKGGVVEGELVDLAFIRQLAALPSKDELRAKLMGTLLAPTQKLAGTLHALLGHLRGALEQRQRQLEA